MLVARDFWRYFVTRVVLRPGQDWKWPRWVARRKVEGEGLKAQACKKFASSCFVVLLRSVLLAEWRETGLVAMFEVC